MSPLSANETADVTNEIGALRKSMTTWVLMLAVANIGAVASVALIVG